MVKHHRQHHRLATGSCLHLSNPQNSPSLRADRCFKIKRNFSWPHCSHSIYKLKNYVVIICLPLPCCQLSSAITAIVINEGSIYQPATTRFLVFTSGSPPPLLLCGFYFFICFSAASIPPFIYSSIHPSVHISIHPSFPLSHGEASFVSARVRLRFCLSPWSYNLPSRLPEVARLLSINLQLVQQRDWRGRLG